MQAMLDAVAPTLTTGARMIVETVEAQGLPEGLYAEALAALATTHTAVSIGSYPSFTAAGFRNQIVVRGKDPVALAAAVEAVRLLVRRLQADRASI
jgi:molybdopterin-biosynthesis enzyme MoeA-like protein